MCCCSLHVVCYDCTAQQCATKAAKMSQCSTGDSTVMWAPHYSRYWGCKCCATPTVGLKLYPDSNWQLWAGIGYNRTFARAEEQKKRNLAPPLTILPLFLPPRLLDVYKVDGCTTLPQHVKACHGVKRANDAACRQCMNYKCGNTSTTTSAPKSA